MRSGKCIGDCAKCELAQSGQVDMIPCAIDQMFQRVQRMEKNIEKIMAGGAQSLAEVEPLTTTNNE